MSSRAVDGFEDYLSADSEVVFVITVGAGAASNLYVVDGVEGADCASSLEGELPGGAGQSANAAGVEGISGSADALSS